MFSAIKLIFDIINKKGLRKQYPKQQRSAYNSLIYTLLSAIMISILMEYPLMVPVHYMWPINIGLLIFIFIICIISYIQINFFRPKNEGTLIQHNC